MAKRKLIGDRFKNITTFNFNVFAPIKISFSGDNSSKNRIISLVKHINRNRKKVIYQKIFSIITNSGIEKEKAEKICLQILDKDKKIIRYKVKQSDILTSIINKELIKNGNRKELSRDLSKNFSEDYIGDGNISYFLSKKIKERCDDAGIV